MEFPFGHHHHRSGGDDEPAEEEERFPPPPHQAPYGGEEGWRAEFDPPPPHHHGRPEFDPPPPHHHVRPEFDSPPPHHHGRPEGEYERADYPQVQHVSHVVQRPPSGWEREEEEMRHQGRPHEGGALDRVATVKVLTKAEENYSLSIRDGKVILARVDPNDDFQHWIKDMKYSTRVKDEEEFPSFALVNKATGQALKHSIGATHPVRLVPYKPDYLDESVLWTESNDLGDGFRCIRMVNNIRLNFDAFHGDEDHGGVHDGTTLVLWEWLKGNNQRWKIVSY